MSENNVSMSTIFGELTPPQVQTLKDGIKEMDVFLSRIDNEKSGLKDVVDSIHEETKIPKKIINRIARVRHKNTFAEVVTEDSEFESLYTAVVGS